MLNHGNEIEFKTMALWMMKYFKMQDAASKKTARGL